MREHLERLAALQGLDSRIARLREAMAGLDDGSDLARRIEAAERKLAALESQHRGKLSEQKDAEQKLWRIEEKLKKERQRMDSGSVRGHKDLQDLQRHIASLQAQRSAADEQVLQAMEQAEALQREASELRDRLGKARTKLAAAVERYTETKARLEAEIAELTAEREGSARSIDPSLLARYEALRQRLGGIGLVAIHEPLCSGCGTSIPNLTFERLLTSAQVTCCENCGRILYRPDDYE